MREPSREKNGLPHPKLRRRKTISPLELGAEHIVRGIPHLFADGLQRQVGGFQQVAGPLHPGGDQVLAGGHAHPGATNASRDSILSPPFPGEIPQPKRPRLRTAPAVLRSAHQQPVEHRPLVAGVQGQHRVKPAAGSAL